MDTKLKQVAQDLLDALMRDKDITSIDSSDRNVSDVSDDGKVTFNMSKEHDYTVPGRRGPGSHVPIGRITYKVTVEASYEKFDDE